MQTKSLDKAIEAGWIALSVGVHAEQFHVKIHFWEISLWISVSNWLSQSPHPRALFCKNTEDQVCWNRGKEKGRCNLHCKVYLIQVLHIPETRNSTKDNRFHHELFTKFIINGRPSLTFSNFSTCRTSFCSFVCPIARLSFKHLMVCCHGEWLLRAFSQQGWLGEWQGME